MIGWLSEGWGVLRYCHIIDICKYKNQAISRRFVRCQSACIFNCRTACLLEFRGLRMTAPPPGPHFITLASVTVVLPGSFPVKMQPALLDNLPNDIFCSVSLTKCPLCCARAHQLSLPHFKTPVVQDYGVDATGGKIWGSQTGNFKACL